MSDDILLDKIKQLEQEIVQLKSKKKVKENKRAWLKIRLKIIKEFIFQECIIGPLTGIIVIASAIYICFALIGETGTPIKKWYVDYNNGMPCVYQEVSFGMDKRLVCDINFDLDKLNNFMIKYKDQYNRLEAINGND